MQNVQLNTRRTTALSRRRGRGLHPKRAATGQNPGRKRPALPEYLEQHEVEGLIRLAPNAAARLLMLIQWRAGLRISEALDLERRDVQVDVDHPTLRVRHGKGNRARLVPVHPELGAALRVTLDYQRDPRQETRLVGVRRSQASAWIEDAVQRAIGAGVFEAGRHVSSHTLRHSYARHLLAHGVPINVLSRWLGHRSLSTTLIYLDLLPDPLGTLAAVP